MSPLPTCPRLGSTAAWRRGRGASPPAQIDPGGMTWQERHHTAWASAPWPLGRTTATPSRCRLAARFRLGGPPHGPQRAVEVQRPGLRLRHHAVEIPARRGPEMRRVLAWSTPQPARSPPARAPWPGRPRPIAAWTRRGRAAASPPRPPPPARSGPAGAGRGHDTEVHFTHARPEPYANGFAGAGADSLGRAAAIGASPTFATGPRFGVVTCLPGGNRGKSSGTGAFFLLRRSSPSDSLHHAAAAPFALRPSRLEI